MAMFDSPALVMIVRETSSFTDEEIVPDETGLHDGVAGDGVSVTASGYSGQGYGFDGNGLISVPHHSGFEFRWSADVIALHATHPPRRR